MTDDAEPARVVRVILVIGGFLLCAAVPPQDWRKQAEGTAAIYTDKGWRCFRLVGPATYTETRCTEAMHHDQP